MKDEEIDACTDVGKIWCFVSALFIKADTPVSYTHLTLPTKA